MMAMNSRTFGGLLGVAGVMFVTAPILIAGAPYESTMGLVQKIFYFHVPSWIAMFLAVFICGFSSAVYLFKEKPAADRLAVAAAELAVLFGLMGLITGPLWAIKAAKGELSDAMTELFRNGFDRELTGSRWTGIQH